MRLLSNAICCCLFMDMLEWLGPTVPLRFVLDKLNCCAQNRQTCTFLYLCWPLFCLAIESRDCMLCLLSHTVIMFAVTHVNNWTGSKRQRAQQPMGFSCNSRFMIARGSVDAVQLLDWRQPGPQLLSPPSTCCSRFHDLPFTVALRIDLNRRLFRQPLLPTAQ